MFCRKLAAALAAVLLLASLVGCAAPQSAPADTSITAVDLAGNTVELKAVPEKIVSLSPSTTEILFALGLGDKIVGIDASSDYPAETANIAVVGDYNGPNIEAIAASGADLVLTAANTLQEEAAAQLKELGIPAVAVEGDAYEMIASSITLIGQLTGKDAEAKALNEQMEKDIQAVKDSVAGKDTPTVYYVMSYGEWGNWTSGPGSFINTIIEVAGGVPATKDAPYSWLEYSLEQLVADDPDILLVSSDLGDPALIADAEGYCELTAVKEGRVYSVDAAITGRPGPRFPEACRTVAELIHPAD